VQVLQGYSTASMTRAEQTPTCGQGLAENSALPARISELLATLAHVLETHRKAHDLEDEDSRHEDEVYRELAEQFRGIARRCARPRSAWPATPACRWDGIAWKRSPRRECAGCS
jgi:hypothetical protein